MSRLARAEERGGSVCTIDGSWLFDSSLGKFNCSKRARWKRTSSHDWVYCSQILKVAGFFPAGEIIVDRSVFCLEIVSTLLTWDQTGIIRGSLQGDNSMMIMRPGSYALLGRLLVIRFKMPPNHWDWLSSVFLLKIPFSIPDTENAKEGLRGADTCWRLVTSLRERLNPDTESSSLSIQQHPSSADLITLESPWYQQGKDADNAMTILLKRWDGVSDGSKL